MTRKAGKIYHWAIGPHMWKRFVTLWNVPMKNVALKMLVADASVHLHAIYWLCQAITSSPLPSQLSGVCPSIRSVVLAMDWPFCTMMLSGGLPLVLKSLSLSHCLWSVRAKGRAVSLRCLVPGIMQRACENTHGYAHTQSSGFGRVGIKPRELTFLNSQVMSTLLVQRLHLENHCSR